jgi:NAD(P)-dependent dehydrogenase (short-subunit alcohol dehydrogenase family)
MNRYDGKCAVVIGGSNGIGLATAKLLADLGVRVLVTGHSPTSIESARATLGETAVVVESDATSPADLQNLAKTIESSLGKIDLLFVNAGMTHFAPLEKVTEEVYGKLFDLNARAPFFTVQKLAPLIADGGSIVFTTSVVNVKGLPMVSVYAATKAALRSMTRSIARELLPRGIRVNAVSPGPINTSILDKTLGPEAAERAKAQMQENNPMKRFGDPIEVAKAVVFLGFDATYTTGAELTVDGGASQL